MSNAPSEPDVDVIVRTKAKEATRTRRVPPYQVILENDDPHSFEFVVNTLCRALGYNPERAYQLTLEAHTKGQSIVWAGSQEVAELKYEQIRTFHEIRDQKNLGPLSCRVEPAPG